MLLTCQWLKSLGADAVVNYKDHPTLDQMKDALAQACPNGVDIYFGIKESLFCVVRMVTSSSDLRLSMSSKQTIQAE